MSFIKGTMIGIMAGAIVGAMNSENMYNMYSKGKRQIKKLKRRYGF